MTELRTDPPQDREPPDADPGEARLRLMIVDDHEVVREGLCATLASEEHFTVVGAAASARTALELARRTLPDVAILDMHLPDASGEDLTRRLRELLPSLVVVVLSSYLTEEAVRRAVAAGAAAYVTKAAGLPELRAALARVWDDRASSASVAQVPQIVRHLEDLIEERSDEQAPTPQQARVLALAARGLTYRQIAERLIISESTVRFHIQKLKVKYGASSKTELIVHGIRLGIIAPPEEARVVDG